MSTTYSTYNTMPHFMAGTARPPQQTSMSPNTQSRITYFITRNNGMPVPLIPADELPFSIKLQNVPRVLSPEQTYGLQYVGTAPYTGYTFNLERDDNLTRGMTNTMERSNSNPPSDIAHARNQSNTGVKFLAPDALARQAMQGHTTFPQPIPGSSLIPKRPVSAASAATSWRRPENTSTSDATQSVIDAILASPSGAETAQRTGYLRPTSSPPPSGITPDQEKKEYCTHWILQGWCAYEQQGCRYKHEMLDKEGLAKIGIRHVPRWWLERNAPVKFGMGLGGSGAEAKGIVGGVLKKPEEWLKMRKESASDADSEGSSTTEVGSEGSTDGTSEEETPVKKAVKKAEKTEEVTKSPVIPATRPPTPAEPKVEEKTRKSSTGSDLIDFAPLLPTPASGSPIQILKRTTTKLEEPTKPAEKPVETTAKSPAPAKTTRIFVPAGESPEKHIAQVKQRERVVRSKSSSPTTAEADKSKVEIISPKDKIIKTEPASPKEKALKPEGLTASRWAPKDGGEKSPRKLTKSGCRPRRPATSPAAAKKEAGGAGKEGEKKCSSQ